MGSGFTKGMTAKQYGSWCSRVGWRTPNPDKKRQLAEDKPARWRRGGPCKEYSAEKIAALEASLK